MPLRKQVDKILRRFEREFAVHNRVEVSRTVILHNVGLFEGLSGMQVIPVLKGNTYGHVIRQVAEAPRGKKLPYIAVDGYFEALRLREVSKQPVLVMGATKPGNFKRLRGDGEDPATVDMAVGMFDHCVDQVRAAGGNPTLLHVAQSAGSVKAKSKYANAMRLGIGLYGINPFPKSHALHAKLKDLRPALRLVSTITKVIELEKGDKVSYNYTFTAPKAMTIGVLPLGYFEGVNRALSNAGVVKVGNEFTPIVGRVCMNHTMIGLEGIDAKIGDEVVVYSNDPRDPNAIDNIAAQHNLFNYNLLTSLSSDVRRVMVE